jgi:hypothetical protein
MYACVGNVRESEEVVCTFIDVNARVDGRANFCVQSTRHCSRDDHSVYQVQYVITVLMAAWDTLIVFIYGL